MVRLVSMMFSVWAVVYCAKPMRQTEVSSIAIVTGTVLNVT